MSGLVKRRQCSHLQLQSSSGSEQDWAVCVAQRSLSSLKLRAAGSAVLEGCVRAWKLGKEEQGLLVLTRDAVLALSALLQTASHAGTWHPAVPPE